METFIATLVIFGGVALAMGVGVIFSDRVLQGSCGGTGKACTCTRAARRDCELRKAAKG